MRLVPPVLLAAALTLAACGGPGGSSGPGAAAEGPAPADTLTVFAAASLGAAFDDLLEAFGADHPDVTIEPATYDGSSTLVTQLIEGARADVLATADQATMATLLDSDLPTGDPVDFATNTLVIAVPAGNPHGVEDLPDLAGRTYAICAPEVPCGAAAGRLFAQRGFEADAVSLEQNVTAVARRVASGEVDAGLVYATDVADRAGELEAVVPAGDPIVNTYPILTLTSDPAARAFADYVLSDAGREILAEHGFGAP
ncbi:molybdate ABC transporter substrate-binding protein [Pseudactinotalea sp. HY158]|uniref:molybdate ABC transporter substrate-binding protein n=1 Tax=Pseudactinotalea sp. HY158 TaxID=2654547 RepID=UPI001E2BBAA9|nr:molybdate ABC transporter substrate-binding protein [Pseudactinotalea sp. HY158]